MGKRFANDFERLDAVKPADKVLIQDSSDGRVKFAFTTQFADSFGGGGGAMRMTTLPAEDTEVVLQPNTLTVFDGEVSALSLSLGGVAQGVAPIYFLEFNTPANTTGTLTFDEPIYWVGVGYRNTFEGVPANAKVAMQIYNRFCLITYCPLNDESSI